MANCGVGMREVLASSFSAPSQTRALGPSSKIKFNFPPTAWAIIPPP